MPNRPEVRIPCLLDANGEASYPASAEPWSSGDTRVDPGIGSDRITPGVLFPAQYANYHKDAFAQILSWLRTIPLQSIVSVNRHTLVNCKAICFDPSQARWIVSGKTDGTDGFVIADSIGHGSFVSDIRASANGGYEIEWLVARKNLPFSTVAPSVPQVIGGSRYTNSDGAIHELTGISWYVANHGTDFQYNNGCHDPVNGIWVIVGNDDTGPATPVILFADDTVLSSGHLVWTAASSIDVHSATMVRDVAVNNSGVFIAVTDSDDVYKSSDGDTWIGITTPPTSMSEAYGVTWSPRWGFVMITDVGVWTSPDGDTWTQRSTIDFSGALNAVAQTSPGTTVGDIEAVGYDAIVIATDIGFLFSYDQGVSWSGLRTGGGAGASTPAAIDSGGGRLGLAAFNIANDEGFFYLSACAGPMTELKT